MDTTGDAIEYIEEPAMHQTYSLISALLLLVASKAIGSI
jgi:hypothetical protein